MERNFHSRIPWHRRLMAATLLPLQLFVTMPLPLFAASPGVKLPTLASSVTVTTIASRGPRDSSLIKPELSLPNNPTDVNVETARVFLEPLYPVGKAIDPEENPALAPALRKFYVTHATTSITDYIAAHPSSRWVAALDFNLGMIHYQEGFLSRAISNLQDSWDLLKSSDRWELHALADRAFGELVVLDAELGRVDELKRLFAEAGDRGFIGSGSERVREAKQGYQIMKTHPSVAFKCGPFALDSIRTANKHRHPRSALVEGAMSTANGTSLAMVKDWSDHLNMNYQMAKRSTGASFIVPSVMHWKLGHFAAVVREKDGKYLIQDPTFGGSELWVKPEALEAETSGYFLVPRGVLPAGWASVDKLEAAKVWGRGGASSQDGKDTKGCTDCSTGMPVASVFPMLATLHIQDTPVVYSTPVGPQVDLTVGYNYQELTQYGNIPFSNFGNDWVFQYSSYLTVDTSQNVTIALRGGGTEIYNYSEFDDVSNAFAPDVESQAQLYLTSPGTYERRMPDGSKDVYSQPDGTGRIFLKQVYDPKGNSLILSYDSNFRLAYIQDQIGQKTNFTYASNTVGAAGFYKVQTIADPFGRSAQFQYDPASTQLIKITDAVGNASQFNYDNNHFIDLMVTPYGKTLFYQYKVASDMLAHGTRITLPDGTQSITETWLYHELNTYHWTRKQSPFYPDKSKARVTHWLQEAGANVESGVVQFTKEPLEGGPAAWATDVATSPTPLGLVNYTYPDSYSVVPPPVGADGNPIPITDQVAHNYVGTTNRPNTISRTLDDGTVQTTLYSTNTFGLLTAYVDPVGRSFSLLYDGNNIDLLEVRQVKGGANDLLAKFSYNFMHEPLSYLDGSGQKTAATYNTLGQITSITDPNLAVTTLNYDVNPTGTGNSGYGYLRSIVGPLAGTADKTSYTYINGQIATVTDSENYTLTLGYDGLDRPVTLTFPDGTYEQVSWNVLDPGFLRDRLGNWTRQQFDSLRQLAAVTDPNGHTTQYNWCTCGSLGSITDPLGHVTSWLRDLQGRVITKTYPDGFTTNYGYEANTSRLKTVTDALNQIKTYSYYHDNMLSGIAYTGAVNPTPNVSCTYDPNYPRLQTVGSSYGTLSYFYYPYVTSPFGATTTGAGQTSQIVNSALGGSTITYTYDALGRVTNRSINGAANSSNWTYDAMSRVTNISNPLGAFVYHYVDDASILGAGGDKGTSRLLSMAYPNGQKTNYSYFPAANDERLQEISNLSSTSAVISKFDYTYDAKGQIATWKQQVASGAPTRYDNSYDAAGQLTGSVLKTDSTNAILHQYYYSFDADGNRTSEQVDSNVTQTSVAPNNLNQIGTIAAGGATRFQGMISQPGSVMVNGQPAAQATGTNFMANPVLTGGTNTVTVVATNGNNVSQTNRYQVVIPTQTSVTPTYDYDGNMLTNGYGQTYAWDAENRLISITYTGGATSTFTYDALGRRVKIVESTGTPTKQFLWCGSQMCEERDTTGTNVTKRFFSQGEQIAATPYYYTRDHLGSIREMTAANGTLEARYAYDSFGRTTPVGTIALASNFQYAGYYEHAASGLNLTLFRAYDPNTAKWLARDPMAERMGPNLYEYADNNPIRFRDTLGLTFADAEAAFSKSAAIEGDEEAAGWLAGGNFDPYVDAGLGVTAIGLGLFVGWELIQPAQPTQCPNHMNSNFPPGFLPGPAGAREWGRRNGVPPKQAQGKFHDIKGKDPMSGATDDYGVNPETGDVLDPEGEVIGNLDD